MAWLRAMGGNATKKIKNIMTDGELNVEFDSAVYLLASSGYSATTQWAYHSSGAYYHAALAQSKVAGFSTSAKVNLRNVKTIIIKFSTNGKTKQTASIDVSDINEGFLVISCARSSSETSLTYFTIYVSSEKTYYRTNALAQVTLDTLGMANNLYVHDIYLD